MGQMDDARLALRLTPRCRERDQLFMLWGMWEVGAQSASVRTLSQSGLLSLQSLSSFSQSHSPHLFTVLITAWAVSIGNHLHGCGSICMVALHQE
jgi:hypothetical protein